MPLVLPTGHPAHPGEATATSGAAPVRVGVINIMPRLEAYEPLLLGPLARLERPVEPVFIRLESHTYGSSDRAHLDRFYRTFDAVTAERPLDGLILTGAPVEELPFKEVRYWPELVALVARARAEVPSTLGLCWGGLALGGMLGIPKVLLPKKLFGVFNNRRLDHQAPLLHGQPGVFRCAHSRHSGVLDADLEHARDQGLVHLLSHGPDTGYTLFATPDQRLVMHLGHPEYVAERLVFEWERDRQLGRDDVEPPRDFDPDRPVTSWHDHRESLFKSWVDLIARRRG